MDGRCTGKGGCCSCNSPPVSGQRSAADGSQTQPLPPHLPEQLPDVLLLVLFGYGFSEGDHVGGREDAGAREPAVVEAFQFLLPICEPVEDLQAPDRRLHLLPIFLVGTG